MFSPRSALVVAALALASCSSAPAPAPMSTSPAALTAPPALASDRAPSPPRGPIDERALDESEASRDPFRAYAPRSGPPPEDTRARKSRRHAAADLKVVGLVTSAGAPRAMLVDPIGKGWIVGVGDLVGRPDTVQGQALSWRVDRIREGAVVLVREDAVGAGDPATTRVLALRHEPLISAED